MSWRVVRSYLDPDEDVAHGDEYHRENVTEHHVGDEEVKGAVHGVGPDLDADLDVGGVGEDDYQVEEDGPRDGGGQGNEPDEQNHDAGSALGDLALERPPYRQESAKT